MIPKKILIVGGAGFIGSHINKMVADQGYETVVFDNLSKGDRRAVVRGEFIQGDLGHEEELEKVFSQHAFDAVIHLAAFIDVGESVVDPAKYYLNNVVNTIKLLEAMRRHHVNVMIFSSTAALYGRTEEVLINEEHPIAPLNPYGETKLMVEMALRDYGNAYGLKWCSLRYFNAAGGDPDGEIKNFKAAESNLIPIILKSLVQGEGNITIFGTDYATKDGTCIRDYIHVCDLGDAHIAAMEKLFQGKKSTCYNLGNGHGFSVREVIFEAERVTGKKVHATEGARRPGDSPILVADATKAKRELHWQPKYSELATIIEHAWNAIKKEANRNE